MTIRCSKSPSPSSLRFRLDPSAFVPDDTYTRPYLQPKDGSSPGSLIC